MTKELLTYDSVAYFAMPAVSNSAMKCYRNEGPWSYYHKCELRSIDEPKKSDAMRIGSLFHKHMECLTTDSRLIDHVDTLPTHVDGDEVNNRKPSHREYLQQFKDDAEKSGKLWATEKEIDQVFRMCETAHENTAASDLLTHSGSHIAEAVCTNKYVGVPVKAMSDLYYPETGVLVDFKTTRCGDSSAFMKEAIFKYGYHYQAAHYCDVFEVDQFFIIAVRNFEPYETIVYEVPPALMDEAREINHDTLRQIRDCRSLGTWHTQGWGKILTMEKPNDTIR